MTSLILKLLLKLAPGLGPWGPVIATVIATLAQAEVAECKPIITALVAESAKDPTLKTGAQKFEWVLPRALAQIAKAQIDIPERFVHLMIEGEVAFVKQVQAAVA
jgi:NADPH-dependent ferric siderophore reductase